MASHYPHAITISILKDADEQTPLHYGKLQSCTYWTLLCTHAPLFLAASCDQIDVVSYLLSNGADPTIRDCDDLIPVQVAGEQSTKQLFQTSSK